MRRASECENERRKDGGKKVNVNVGKRKKGCGISPSRRCVNDLIREENIVYAIIVDAGEGESERESERNAEETQRGKRL